MTGRKTLDDLLAPISAQLGRTKVPQHVARDKSSYPTPSRVTDGLDAEELVKLFVSEAEKVRVTVHRCNMADAAKTVCDIVAEEPGNVVLGADDKLAALGILPALEASGNCEAVAWDATQAERSIQQAAQARYGVTFCVAGLAETATVVQPASEQCGRSVSLLPLTHIALVKASTIVGTMADYMASVDAGTLPSQVCFISGPSATADIELVRVEGVHGPMYVHYVILDE